MINLISYDLDVEVDDIEFNELKNCLFDKNILFVFSIYINSPIPFLAGVLMFMLLYFISIIKNFISFINEIKDLAKLGLKSIVAIIDFIKNS